MYAPIRRQKRHVADSIGLKMLRIFVTKLVDVLFHLASLLPEINQIMAAIVTPERKMFGSNPQ